MSKIGKKIITIPQGIEVKLEGDKLEVKGPKGTLNLEVNRQIKLEIADGEIKTSPLRSSKEANALWGLTRALVNNMIIGAKNGYEKKLELQGVGFRMSLQGKKLVMALGFSHPVEVIVPEGLTVKIEENNTLSISGFDKQKVGQFTANIRALKKVEPYKGKGFRYQGEKVIRKVGKKAGAVK
ncbi:MAG TPA: 50S ribosomal protein L6 [Candidatus Moranbacteria bacterium]|nr:50S ribosomal protein L6 [Candidatus Moranbacteria bacterium]